MSDFQRSMRRYAMAVNFIVGVPGTALAAGEAEPAGDPTTFGSDKPKSGSPSATRSADSAHPHSLDVVTVTGSRLTRAEEQSAQEVLTYDRARIERSGQSTVNEFLATIPQVSLNSVESTFGATSVRLRGAREGSALILINGRRSMPVTGSGAFAGFFDLNTIPLSMVERIEVLPNGSSAIYGGEALAGVVNIVLRSGFQGAEASVGYKGAKNTDEKMFYAGGGWKNDTSAASVIVSHSERSSLAGADRDITSNSDLRRFGGPNLTSPFFGVPATIFSVSGNLPGLTSGVAAVPRGSSGIGLQPSDFGATAGTQNAGSFNSYQQILNDLDRTGLFASAAHRFRNGVELFAELLASDYTIEGQTTPPLLQQTTVPATNAFNPFGGAVRAAGFVAGTESLSRFSFEETFVRPLVGARGKVGTWDWELTALYSRDWGRQVVSIDTASAGNAARLTAALASSNPATALNPFVDGPMASPQLLASIFRDSNVVTWSGKDVVTTGFARGAVTELPAGPLQAVVGAELEWNSLERGMEASRSVKAGFTELRVPLFAQRDGSGARREVLAIQGAARLDNYSDFGTQSTYQAGIEFRPTQPLLLRATYGTAFKPPTLFNLGEPFLTQSTPSFDPRRNGEAVSFLSTSGGNRDLDPTTSESSTLGIVWSPREVPGLNLSLTAWKLRISNAIARPNPRFIVDNESIFPGKVVRAPAAPGEVGQIVSVDATYINFGTMHESGVDASADWTIRTQAGVFTPAIAATYMTEFDGASTPGAPSVNRLSRAISDNIFAPRLKGTASIAWSPNATFTASLTGRYTGRYYDYTPPRTLGDVWYLDGAVEIALGRTPAGGAGRPPAFKLLITGTNLTDKSPPWSTHFRGYDIYNYDIIGRTIFVRLQANL